jgi:protein phosphatase 1 regulatory subunit 7
MFGGNRLLTCKGESMTYRFQDGFRFFDGQPDDDIVIEPDRVEQYAEYINKKKIKHVTVRIYSGYIRKDINFIKHCPDIEYLDLVNPLISDYSPIYGLHKLKLLSLEDPHSIVDLGHLESLEELYVEHHHNIINLDKCKNLKILHSAFYNPESKNIEELSNLENLTELSIYRSTICSIEGIGNLHKLEHLFIYGFTKLDRIDELIEIADSLTVLVLTGCKKIDNFDNLAGLKKLKVLKLVNCGNIPSIKFIKKIPDLKAFVFVDSNIVDGDLSPCIGLEFVGFFNKKHYSHKSEDFPRDNISPEIETLGRLQ